jgi:predicted nucleotidyltransferase
MRSSRDQAEAIGRLAREVAGEDARVRLFGSRLDDRALGGDVDLLLEVPSPVANPALTAATLSALKSRC